MKYNIPKQIIKFHSILVREEKIGLKPASFLFKFVVQLFCDVEHRICNKMFHYRLFLLKELASNTFIQSLLSLSLSLDFSGFCGYCFWLLCSFLFPFPFVCMLLKHLISSLPAVSFLFSQIVLLANSIYSCAVVIQ